MKKFLQLFFGKKECLHDELEVAVAKEEDTRQYQVHCPKCGLPIKILVVGYTLTNGKPTGCPKKLYMNKKDAETVVNWCTVQRFYRHPLRMYYCEKEKGWHITKKPLNS